MLFGTLSPKVLLIYGSRNQKFQSVLPHKAAEIWVLKSGPALASALELFDFMVVIISLD